MPETSQLLSSNHQNPTISFNPVTGNRQSLDVEPGTRPLSVSPYLSTNIPSVATSARTSLTHIDPLSMDNPETHPPQHRDRPLEADAATDNSHEPSINPTAPSDAAHSAPLTPDIQTTEAEPTNPLPTDNFSHVPEAVPPEVGSVTPPVSVPQTPQVTLCFLLVSGTRKVMSFDPEMTVGRVKELVWISWPPEWTDDRPPAPSYLRILYLGKILQDEDTLRKLSFPIYPEVSSIGDHSADSTQSPADPAPPAPQPTIVHLSIRPYAPSSADDDGLMKKKRRRTLNISGTSTTAGVDGENGAGAGGCCGCIIC